MMMLGEESHRGLYRRLSMAVTIMTGVGKPFQRTPPTACSTSK
jgi:hypothetical protein